MDNEKRTETTETTQDPTDWRSEDGIWLDHLAERLAVGDSGVVFDEETIKRLRGIAIGCDQLALEKKRLGVLENQVDQKLCQIAETWLSGDDVSDYAMIAAAVWLLGRRYQAAGVKGMIGAGLGTLGAAVLGAAFEKPKTVGVVNE